MVAKSLNLDDAEIEESKRDLITREIGKFREVMKVIIITSIFLDLFFFFKSYLSLFLFMIMKSSFMILRRHNKKRNFLISLNKYAERIFINLLIFMMRLILFMCNALGLQSIINIFSYARLNIIFAIVK